MLALVSVDMILYQINIKETKGNPQPDNMPGPEESWCGKREKFLDEIPEKAKLSVIYEADETNV